MRSNIQVWLSSTLVLLSCIKNSVDHSFCHYIILTEISCGISALKLCLCCCYIQIYVDSIQVIIQPNRSDMIWRNLTFIAIITAIAQHNRSRQFFVKHHAIDVVQIAYVIEVSDVRNIIPVKCILNIYSLWISGSSNQLEVSSLSLLFSFLVALCSQSIDVTDINLSGPDSGNRTLMYLVYYGTNPALVISNQLRRTWSHILILWEQSCYVTISRLYKPTRNSVMLKRIIGCINLHCILECSNLACLS